MLMRLKTRQVLSADIKFRNLYFIYISHSRIRSRGSDQRHCQICLLKIILRYKMFLLHEKDVSEATFGQST